MYIGDIGGTCRDAAHVKWGSPYLKWGGTWRMPTWDEFQELIDNCTWTWTTLNGVYGGRFTSKKNGNSIFLPAAGSQNGTSLYCAGGGGDYWSSTPYGCITQYACGLIFDSTGHDWYFYARYYGLSVRPVSE